MTEPAPTIPVTVELGWPMPTEQLAFLGDQLGRWVASALAETVTQYGLDGEPTVSIRAGTPDRMIRLRVHGVPVPYDPQLLARIWRATAPLSLRDLPAQPVDARRGFPDGWLAAYLGDLDEASLGPILDYLARLVPEIARMRPGCLVGPGQAAAYVRTARLYASLEGEQAVAEANQVLRAVLDEGHAVTNRQLITAMLAAGRRVGRSVEDTVEALRPRLRSPRLEVRLAGPEPLQTTLASVRALVLQEWGVLLPDMIVVSAPELPADHLAVKVHDQLRPPVLIIESVEETLYAELMQVIDRFVDLEDVEQRLVQLQASHPDLVRAAVAYVRIAELTRVLRALLSERLDIRGLSSILERLVGFDTIPIDGTEYDVVDDRLALPADGAVSQPRSTHYLRWIREQSRDDLSQRYAPAGTLAVNVLSPELERLALAHSHGAPDQEPEGDGEIVRAAVWNAVGASPIRDMPPILTSAEARNAVRALLAPELAHLPVLARSELRPDLRVQQLATITAH